MAAEPRRPAASRAFFDNLTELLDPRGDALQIYSTSRHSQPRSSNTQIQSTSACVTALAVILRVA